MRVNDDPQGESDMLPEYYRKSLQLARNDASLTEHLTDTDFIELTIHLLPMETEKRLRAHLQSCSRCSMEVDRLAEANRAWDMPGAMRRRESRIRPKILTPEAPKKANWRSLEWNWTAVASLRPPLGALAAANDFMALAFPIMDGEHTLDDLAGSLERRGSEYYVRITGKSDDRTIYRDQKVELVIADVGLERLILEHQLSVGQYKLLGTQLPLTETTQIAARLIR